MEIFKYFVKFMLSSSISVCILTTWHHHNWQPFGHSWTWDLLAQIIYRVVSGSRAIGNTTPCQVFHITLVLISSCTAVVATLDAVKMLESSWLFENFKHQLTSQLNSLPRVLLFVKIFEINASCTISTTTSQTGGISKTLELWIPG